MTVRLRAHHLLCILTYVGRGYTPAFTANYDRIVKQVASGAQIEIVAGPDDICAPLLGQPDPHCLRDSVNERDEHASREVGALLGHVVGPGARMRLRGHAIEKMRQAFAAGSVRSACAGCEWSPLCDTIAGSGFGQVRLVPECPV